MDYTSLSDEELQAEQDRLSTERQEVNTQMEAVSNEFERRAVAAQAASVIDNTPQDVIDEIVRQHALIQAAPASADSVGGEVTTSGGND